MFCRVLWYSVQQPKRCSSGPSKLAASHQDPGPTQRGQADALVPGRVRRHHLCGQRQVVSLGAPDVRAEPAPPGGNPACSAGAAVVIPGKFRCAANNPPRNPTVASAAELAHSGPGGASKNPRLRWRRGLPGGQLEQPTQTRDLRPQPPQLATATGRPRSTRSRISLTLTTVRARNPPRWLPDSSRRAYSRSCRTHVR
jgi:hypothetical protein